jgi:hypothetical protein
MQAIFLELPPFERVRQDYLDDEGYRKFQQFLLANPLAGDLIEGTGGLRKIRHRDSRRAKGKRGGFRIIYYWWMHGAQFWLFTIYDKDEMSDLTSAEKKALKSLLDREVAARSQ